MTWSRGGSHVIVIPVGLPWFLAVISGNTVSIKGTRYFAFSNASIFVGQSGQNSQKQEKKKDRETYLLCAEFFAGLRFLAGANLVGLKMLCGQLGPILF